MRSSLRIASITALAASLAQLGPLTGVPVDANEVQLTEPQDTVASLRLPHGPAQGPWIAAHRGQWRDSPENSIPAILSAIQDGAEIVEIDISQTKDGQLVLMHDKTVDRTTDGSGEVANLTLKEIKNLRLRERQGNGPAPVTDHQVPTFKEVLEAIKGQNVLLNLDKGWEHRNQLFEEVSEAGMLDYVIFKGSPTVEDAVAFMKGHPDAYYMHVINDAEAEHVDQFGEVLPQIFEIAWNDPADIQGTDQFWKKIDGKAAIFANSMWDSVSGGHTDEASLIDPATGWGYHTSRGADIIQTDNIKAIAAWRSGQDVTKLFLPDGSVRVQAEHYVNDPKWFFDVNPENECKVPVVHPENPVDACNLDGAQIIQYIRDGEYWALDFEIPIAGEYELTMRQSADTEPGGTVTVETEDGQRRVVATPNTTHNRHLTTISLGKYGLEKGTNRIKFTFSHPDYMSVDWVQAEPVSPQTSATTAPESVPEKATPITAPTPAPETATTEPFESSSKLTVSAGAFVSGVTVGALCTILAMANTLGGPIISIVKQIRSALRHWTDLPQ